MVVLNLIGGRLHRRHPKVFSLVMDILTLILDSEEELVVEKPVTHVLLRRNASPAKVSAVKAPPARRAPARGRKAPAKAQRKGEVTLDSSNYEFSKDYSEEERAYQELTDRKNAISIKETHYEEDEDEVEEEEDEDDEEYEDEDDEEEEEEEEEEKETVHHDGDEYMGQEETEDFILPARRSIFTPLKNAIFFTIFFIRNLIVSIYTAIKFAITRTLEIFLINPILWIISSFQALFHSLNQGLSSLFSALGTASHNDLFKKSFATIVSLALIAVAIPPTLYFIQTHDLVKPFFALHYPSSYVAPDLPPTTAEEIIDRLLEVERHLITYSSLSNKVLQENKLLQQDSEIEKSRRAALDDSIYLLKQDLEKLASHAKTATQHISDLKLFNKDTKDSIKDLQSTLLKLDSDLEKAESERKSEKSRSEAATTEIKHLKSNIDALKRGLTHVEAELKRVSDYDFLSQVALKSIESYLPNQLAVKMNPKTKRIEINPEFWTALRSVFADRDEMSRSVASQASKIADAKIVHKEISWNDFLRGNEEAIKGFVKVQMDERWNKAGEDGVVVSRDYFLEILRDRIGELRGDMDGKMRALLEKFETSSKENVAKAMASADAFLKRVKKSSGKVDLSTDAMNSIVETALHRYTTDTLAKPDYALYSSGARVNPHLTSPTYHAEPASLVKRIGSFFFGRAGATWGHPPPMALFPDTNVGMCWAFPGSQGGLGIRLSETVLVTDVSVEHIHRDVSQNIGTAPKTWYLYALVPNPGAREQIDEINRGIYENPLPSLNVPKEYTLLTHGEYDINEEDGRTIQTVPVPAAIRRLNVPVQQVLFVVESNWGNREYTCLYRVRVHGQGIHGPDEDADKGFGDDLPV